MKCKKRIHILGKGAGWDKIKDVKPGKDDEIWGVNDCFLRTKTVGKTFHMHDMEVFSKQNHTESSVKLTILNANEKPKMDFYTIYEWDKIPHSKEYPLDEVIDHFKVCYFSSTPEYMIALAVMWGVEELYYYGINMSVRQEYIQEKPGVEFWTGMAMGRGVKVHLQHENTSLLKVRDGKLYGYLMNQWRVDDKEIND